MENQKQFIDTIESLKDLALAKGNYLTKKDISDSFEGMSLNEKQEEIIYSYLKSNNILVEGYEGDEGIFADEEEYVSSQDEEEQHFLDMYYEELKEIKKYSKQEVYKLYKKIKEEPDDEKALVEELIKSQLKNVIDWVAPLKDNGISLSDLIGEANLTLVNAVNNSLGEDLNDGDEVVAFIKDEVIEYVTIMANSENESLLVENMALDKVNEVNEVVTKLYNKMLRPVKVSEIAASMNISEEEVRNILNVANNKIKNVE